ncbi:hypothetical protein L7F22_025848 [Adiantum nelumboides]|nr:hypothetical protein [Adiantum nelumboides]
MDAKLGRKNGKLAVISLWENLFEVEDHANQVVEGLKGGGGGGGLEGGNEGGESSEDALDDCAEEDGDDIGEEAGGLHQHGGIAAQIEGPEGVAGQLVAHHQPRPREARRQLHRGMRRHHHGAVAVVGPVHTRPLYQYGRVRLIDHHMPRTCQPCHHAHDHHRCHHHPPCLTHTLHRSFSLL